MRSRTQRHGTKAGDLQGAWKEIKVSEEPKAGEIVFKFKDKVLYEDGESAFPAQAGLAQPGGNLSGHQQSRTYFQKQTDL